jgi:hypothetical protein
MHFNSKNLYAATNLFCRKAQEYVDTMLKEHNSRSGDKPPGKMLAKDLATSGEITLLVEQIANVSFERSIDEGSLLNAIRVICGGEEGSIAFSFSQAGIRIAKFGVVLTADADGIRVTQGGKVVRAWGAS